MAEEVLSWMNPSGVVRPASCGETRAKHPDFWREMPSKGVVGLIPLRSAIFPEPDCFPGVGIKRYTLR
jgi:hypothetical protein